MPNNSATLPSTPAAAPVVLDGHAYTCSDCVTPTRASEVHDLAGGDVVAYCKRCAHSFRAFAVAIYPARIAHQRGLVVTL